MIECNNTKSHSYNFNTLKDGVNISASINHHSPYIAVGESKSIGNKTLVPVVNDIN